MNRIDKVVVFHPLRPDHLNEILEIELGMVQQRVCQTAKEQFLFGLTQPAKEFLLREGTDVKYGARHLKRAIERYLTCPLAGLLSTGQVRSGDEILIDWDGETKALLFSKRTAELSVAAGSELQHTLKQAASATSGGRELVHPGTGAGDESSFTDSPAISVGSIAGLNK
jgi:hypothetical protein